MRGAQPVAELDGITMFSEEAHGFISHMARPRTSSRTVPRWPKRHLKTRWGGAPKNKDVIKTGTKALSVFDQSAVLASGQSGCEPPSDAAARYDISVTALYDQ